MGLGSDREVAALSIGLLDLTDLGDSTNAEAAKALCARALDAGVAAVCVWPDYVAVCAEAVAGSDVRVATVANFPSGDEALTDVLDQARRALDDGADEIDVVLPYQAWLGGDSQHAADVLDGVRELVTEPRIIKVIIESGELPDRSAIDRATMFAISHGADFVKTSTGKTAVSATPEAAEIILEAIDLSGRPVGFKASGGIRTISDARLYLELAAATMGDGWVSPRTFRFGATALLDVLLATGRD